jgi:hypothetical protein
MPVSRNQGWQRLAILVLVAVAARGLTFGNPIAGVDEEFYFTVGRAMWSGALPFVDVWDRKPIGLFLLYAVPAGFGFPAGIWVYQALALAAVVATGWLIARLAERSGYAAGATAAGIAYILWLGLLGGHGGQSPVFYNLPTIAAVLLILRSATGAARRRAGVGAMALVGIGLQIKYSLVFEGMFFGLWLLAAEWREARTVSALLGYGALLVAVSMLPTALAAAFYAAIGHWDAFLYANFLSILRRNPDGLLELASNFGRIVLIMSPLVASAIVALVRSAPFAASEPGRARRFVAIWLAVAIGSVLIFRPWFDHYALPILLPACAAAAEMLGSDGWRRRFTPALLAIAAIGGQIVLLTSSAGRGNATQFAALTRTVGRGPGCLYLYSGSTMLYASTQRCSLSRYIMPSHLSRTREAGATGVDQDQEIRRILAAGPAVVVIRPPYRGERPAAHRLVTQAMARDYRLAAQLPMGSELVSVYRRSR